MAQVSLQINGYGYVLGCADGEEAHLISLAAGLDRRIEEVKTATGISGEGRLLVMAALMLSDELHDLKKQAGLGSAAAPPPPAPPPAKAGRRLRGLAKRAEDIADLAEAPAPAAMPQTTEPQTLETQAPGLDETAAPAPAPLPAHAENIAAPNEQA